MKMSKQKNVRKRRANKVNKALEWAFENRQNESFTKKDLLANPWKRTKPSEASVMLRNMCERGLLVKHGSTRNAYYTLAEARLGAADPDVDAVIAEESGDEVPVNPWVSARLATGQKALNIATICDALLAGEAGLNALNEIKNQAVLILADLELLED